MSTPQVDSCNQALSEYFPPKPKWGVEDIPDLTGMVAIVTGGYAGIGYEIVRPLLKKNCKVYIASRSQSKAEAAITKLTTETGGDGSASIHFLHLDLADLPSVKQAAETFLSKENRLNLLINNAGVMQVPVELTTKQGYDMSFGTNCMGHYYLTALLLPLLISTAAELDVPSRVVDLASDGHGMNCGKGDKIIQYETLNDGEERRRKGSMQLYCQSKSGNVLVSQYHARKYADSNVVFTSLNPGHIRSELTRHVEDGFGKKLVDKLLLHPTPLGALTPLYAATAPEAALLNGGYLIPWARVGRAREDHYNHEVQDRLVAWLDEQIASL